MSNKRALIAEKLCHWFNNNQRSLTWRKNYSAYEILVSEFMLQQTQVATVMPFYKKWLQIFPDLNTLATTSEHEVLRYWAGLGYYSRARNLHKSAQIICEQHEGIIPKQFELLIKLPGIGAYTAGAIASIAYNQPVAAIDGNNKRVLSRLFAYQKTIDDAAAAKFFNVEALQLIEHKPARFVNQALMELGSTICKPQPLCISCPLIAECAAFQQKLTKELPYKKRKVRLKNKTLYHLVFYQKGKIFLQQVKESKKWWQGLWVFPYCELAEFDSLALDIDEFERFLQFKHGVSVYKVNSTALIITGHPPENWHGKWFDFAEISQYPISQPTQKIYTQLVDNKFRG